MKFAARLLAVILIAIPAAACQQTFGTLGKVTEFATVGIKNPVSYEALAGAEAAVATARTGAIAYLGLPVCRYGTAVTISNVCSKPDVRREIKLYNRKVNVALTNARKFVRQNPTVNAQSVISLVYQAIDDLNAVKARNAIAN